LIGVNANRSVVSATKLTNYVGIGDHVLIDADNQVKLGNPYMTQTVLYGDVVLTWTNEIYGNAGGLTNVTSTFATNSVGGAPVESYVAAIDPLGKHRVDECRCWRCHHGATECS